jgi:hypothetical protein
MGETTGERKMSNQQKEIDLLLAENRRLKITCNRLYALAGIGEGKMFFIMPEFPVRSEDWHLDNMGE